MSLRDPARRRLLDSGIWEAADMEPIRVALHADGVRLYEGTLGGSTVYAHPLMEAAWTLRQEWRRDHPPNEWERYAFQWEMSMATWTQLTEEARHSDPNGYALRYPTTPDERVSLFGWPILLANHPCPDGTWRIDLIVERLTCPELHTMRVDIERGQVRCVRCGHQLGPSGYNAGGFVRAAAAIGIDPGYNAGGFVRGMIRGRNRGARPVRDPMGGWREGLPDMMEPSAVPPHPRTQAINDEFGWEDAHNSTGWPVDPWTGEAIE